MVKSSGDSISVSSSSTRRSSARIAKAAAASASENQEDTKAKQQRHQEFKYAKAVQGPKKVPVLSSEYIEQSTSRNDLVRRLRIVVKELGDEDVVAHSDEYPGLEGLSALLVDPKFINHKDKEVRLQTCLACMEIFYLYAPEPPWDEDEILSVFSQTIRQLGNLSHCTSPSQSNFHSYFRLLEQLALVKIGVVLVELVKTTQYESRTTTNNDDGSDFDSVNDGEEKTEKKATEGENEALEMLVSLIRTILTCVQTEHPPEVSTNAVSALAACIEEFESVPVAILDEILFQVGIGSETYVTNPAYVEATANNAAQARKNKKSANSPKTTKASNKGGGAAPDEKLPPKEIAKTNQSYVVAATIIRRTEDRIAGPISTLLNGILNSLPEVIERTNIAPKPSNPNSNNPVVDVYAIIYELHNIAPSILTTVIGTVSSNLQTTDDISRLQSVKLLGRLFYSKRANIAENFNACYREWTKRYKDKSEQVRIMMVQCLVLVLQHKKVKSIRDMATNTLVEILNYDPHNDVRIEAVHKVCDLAYTDPSVCAPELIKAVGGRIASKNKIERKNAATGLAQCYYRNFSNYVCSHVQKGGDDVDILVIIDALEELDDTFTTDSFYGSKHIRSQFEWIPGEICKAAGFTDTIDADMRNRVIQIIDDVLFGSPGKLTSTSKAVCLARFMDSIKLSHSEKFLSKLLDHRAALQKAMSSYVDARAKASTFKAKTSERLVADAHALEQFEMVSSLTAPPTANNSGSGSNSNVNASSLKTMLKKIHDHRDKHLFRVLSTITTCTHSQLARKRAFDEVPKRCQSLGNQSSQWLKTLARRCAMGASINQEVISHCIILAYECFNQEEFEKAMMLLYPVDIISKSFPGIIIGEAFNNLISIFGLSRESSAQSQVLEEVGLVTCVSRILARTANAVKNDDKITKDSMPKLSKNLIRLCVQDGNPEQTRFAVEVLHSLDDKDSLLDLLQKLTSRKKLRIDNNRILSTFNALSALVERAPELFTSGRETKAVEFAQSVLLGQESESTEDDNEDDNKDESDGEEDSESNDKDEEEKKKKPSGRKKKDKMKGELSLSCSRICAATNFLVSYVSSIVKYSKIKKDETLLPKDLIESLFKTLTQIISDNGLPPSTRDATDSEFELAAFRKNAATNILRLSDPYLQLTDTYLTPNMWQTFSSCFLDSDKSVRTEVINVLMKLLTGQAASDGEAPTIKFAPPLQFLSLVVLCVDSDNSSLASSNANAAVVGRVTQMVKKAALQCILFLRKTSELTLARCRSMGTEKKFEKNYKFKLMPEFAIPYALHMLSFREETPSFISADNTILKKRLKWLIEPIISSLGDGADNISFLLRMVELIGDKHTPVAEGMEADVNKLKVVCYSAREVLLKLVKKDINLTVYPGQIQIPGALFRKNITASAKKAALSTLDSEETQKEPPRKARMSYGRQSKEEDKSDLATKKGTRRRKSQSLLSQELFTQPTTQELFGGFSPIARADSPSSVKKTSSKDKNTLFNTPDSKTSATSAKLDLDLKTSFDLDMPTPDDSKERDSPDKIDFAELSFQPEPPGISSPPLSPSASTKSQESGSSNKDEPENEKDDAEADSKKSLKHTKASPQTNDESDDDVSFSFSTPAEGISEKKSSKSNTDKTSGDRKRKADKSRSPSRSRKSRNKKKDEELPSDKPTDTKSKSKTKSDESKKKASRSSRPEKKDEEMAPDNEIESETEKALKDETSEALPQKRRSRRSRSKTISDEEKKKATSRSKRSKSENKNDDVTSDNAEKPEKDETLKEETPEVLPGRRRSSRRSRSTYSKSDNKTTSDEGKKKATSSRSKSSKAEKKDDEVPLDNSEESEKDASMRSKSEKKDDEVPLDNSEESEKDRSMRSKAEKKDDEVPLDNSEESEKDRSMRSKAEKKDDEVPLDNSEESEKDTSMRSKAEKNDEEMPSDNEVESEKDRPLKDETSEELPEKRRSRRSRSADSKPENKATSDEEKIDTTSRNKSSISEKNDEEMPSDNEVEPEKDKALKEETPEALPEKRPSRRSRSTYSKSDNKTTSDKEKKKATSRNKSSISEKKDEEMPSDNKKESDKDVTPEALPEKRRSRRSRSTDSKSESKTTSDEKKRKASRSGSVDVENNKRSSRPKRQKNEEKKESEKNKTKSKSKDEESEVVSERRSRRKKRSGDPPTKEILLSNEDSKAKRESLSLSPSLRIREEKTELENDGKEEPGTGEDETAKKIDTTPKKPKSRGRAANRNDKSAKSTKSNTKSSSVKVSVKKKPVMIKMNRPSIPQSLVQSSGGSVRKRRTKSSRATQVLKKTVVDELDFDFEADIDKNPSTSVIASSPASTRKSNKSRTSSAKKTPVKRGKATKYKIKS